MTSPDVFRLVQAASTAVRLDAAVRFLLQQPADAPALIVGASRGAADDLARRVALARPATLGLTRLSLTQLASRLAMRTLAGQRLVPGTPLGAEAVAARAVFDARREQSLKYFGPVAETPGFPSALVRTLQELRLTGITADRLRGGPLGRQDLSSLLERFEAAFAAAAAVDRAGLFTVARERVLLEPIGGAVVLLDVPMEHEVDRALVAALIQGAASVMATLPRGDRGVPSLVAAGAVPDSPPPAPAVSDLEALRLHLFDDGATPPERPRDDSLELFSAPGEGRECVEIARRVLACARRGMAFDQMAILVRSPRNYYFGLIEHALRRAGVPAWFDRGTRRPHPAGRAFLALLACAAEQLSAVRFAEYLSLAQVPRAGQERNDLAWTPSADDTLFRGEPPPGDEHREEEQRAAGEPVEPDQAVVAGTLRSPRRWEQLLAEAAVIGQSAARWRRRLDGRAREIERQLREAERAEGPDTGQTRALELSLQHLDHLRGFALPVVETLSGWPPQATWGEWLALFEALAPRVLAVPTQVLRVLADLRPMSDVGPIDLDEARRVLSDRLLTLDHEPPVRRFGRVFVGTPAQARGRSFRAVFVPGLAERLFPQKPREDPLLLDEDRQAIDDRLPTQDRRLMDERQLLQLAVDAASERLFVSYPRIDLAEARARVPSFYALDLIRAATGRLPDHESLEESARQAGKASLAWPAPAQPEDAIDDQEHDLAVLRRLLDDPSPAGVKGHAHYLLGLNEALRRSVVARWARGQSRWSPHDGFTRVAPHVAEALASQRLHARSYSLSALQRFSTCPYQFALSAILRLQPLETPEPLQRMDPLTRGSLFHEMQARFFREMQRRDALPVTLEQLEAARGVLAAIVETVAAEAHDELAPAVERVWVDEVAAIHRDLSAWLGYLAADGHEWHPLYFELAFGAVPGERDPHSRAQDVVLDGFRLRGAVDLIEAHRLTGVLRVTDHKTGRKPEGIDKVVIGGGSVLQPVLYSMAVSTTLKRPVQQGRLFYCTAAGGFSSHAIPMNDATRDSGVAVLRTIDQAIAHGILAAAPAEGACGRCDFRSVCGPDAARRVRRKSPDILADLIDLRRRA